MTSEEQAAAKFELLMNTLPAMLALTMRATGFLIERLHAQPDGTYKIGRATLEEFARHIKGLKLRRENQMVPDATGWNLVDKLYVPTVGDPATPQIAVADEGGDEAERRSDFVAHLFRERRMLDLLLVNGIDAAGCACPKFALHAQGGQVYAYRVPPRVRDALVAIYQSPILNNWHPGEYRHAEVIAALNEARGLPAPTPMEVFGGRPFPRLMLRVSDLLSPSAPEEGTAIEAPLEKRAAEMLMEADLAPVVEFHPVSTQPRQPILHQDERMPEFDFGI
jgi:hypothetical protein